MFFKEIDQLIPEASRQLRSDLDRSLWVLVVQINGFQLLNRSAFLFLFPFSRIKFSQCMGDSVGVGWGFHVFQEEYRVDRSLLLSYSCGHSVTLP